jgi:uncharacterized membrane protein
LDEASSGQSERGLARLDAFSDGVFAIAITLLVLDIKVPRGEHDLVAPLLAQWPAYVGYVVSFVIIGIWWAGHHALLDTVERSDHGLLLANTLHLMCIGFLPFSTALLAEYLRESGQQLRTAVVVYVGTLLLAGLTFNLVWHQARRASLLRSSLSPAAVARSTRVFAASALSYLIAFVLAFVVPIAALAICVGIALFYGLPPGSGRARAAP